MVVRRPCFALALLLLSAVACTSPELGKTKEELTACEASRKSTEAMLSSCRTQTAASLDLLARNLDSVLNRRAAEPEPTSEPTASPPSPEPAPTVQVAPQMAVDAATLERVQLLTTAITNSFALLRGELEAELAAARRESRDDHRSTRDKVEQLATATTEGQAAEVQRLRAELDEARRQQASDREAYQAAAQKLAEKVRGFDATVLTCKGCGKGFTDPFGLRLLTFHGEVVQGLDDLKSAPAPQP